MSEASGFPHGTPSWVDLGTPDMDATGSFYGGLFGWEVVAAGSEEETAGYSFFTLNGKLVAGVGPLMSDDQPPTWTTYVSVDDAADTTAKVKAAGGQAMVEPMQVMQAGTMAVFVDSVGAVIAGWQPDQHKGAQLVNEPGALTWNELTTRDIDAAKSFYGAVFGWEGETTTMSGPMGDTVYTQWKLGDKLVGGMIQMDDNWPAELPSHWMTYFSVDDTDAAAAKAQELGGKVSVPPSDLPVGRFAVLNDPAGAFFSVIRLTAPTG